MDFSLDFLNFFFGSLTFRKAGENTLLTKAFFANTYCNKITYLLSEWQGYQTHLGKQCLWVPTQAKKQQRRPARRCCLLVGEPPQTPIERTMLVRLRVLRTLMIPEQLSQSSFFACTFFLVLQQTIHVFFCSKNDLHVLTRKPVLRIKCALFLPQVGVLSLNFFYCRQLINP